MSHSFYRLNPYKGEENLFIYCYRRDWLDRHMKQAEKGIRFITPHYEEHTAGRELLRGMTELPLRSIISANWQMW